MKKYCKVAFFDVDRTLIRGVSTEAIFIKYLIKKGKLGLIDILRTILFLFKTAPRLRKGIFDFKKNKSYLKNKSVEDIKILGQTCFEKEILCYLSSEAKALIGYHKERGDLVVLLSGSLDFLVESLRRHIGADEVIATEVTRKNGVFLGKINGLYPYGINKLELAKEFCEKRGFDLKGSYAYADHYSDRYILEGVGHPVAVNPDIMLKRFAEEKGWKITSL